MVKLNGKGSKTVRHFERHELKRIIKYVKGSNWINYRDVLLVVMGANTGLRIIDLLNITVGQVRYLQPGDTLAIVETKTGKDNVIVCNKPIYKALQSYLEIANPMDDEPLFRSRKGGVLRSDTVGDMIQSWAKALKLPGRFGCHSLRKSWGYISRTVYGVDFGTICNRYNHAHPKITMRYLGLTSKDVVQALMNPITI
jgi:integrase